MDRIPGGWHSATVAGLCNPWIPAAGKLAETGARTEENEGWLKVGLVSGIKSPPGSPGRAAVSSVIPSGSAAGFCHPLVNT
ncbi:hypothetical protein NSU18_15590 [Paenibacillus sp. FSL H8-0048]|uniref:hypothetical protein n=1 Tax=Paenibacillus sp. FSL H8-0048 TaxID=2954508 RepID=UPI0030F83C12